MRYFALVTLALSGAVQQKPALPVAPEGWKVEIVAEPPKVQHPVVVCCAPDGRVFVGEDPMDMKPPAHKTEGRVICLHPDGRSTVFAEKLYAPFGLLYLDGKLYVHHSPRLSVFTDDDGVGKDRVDLIPCTNPAPWALDWNDHIPANFRLAMDGRLYMAVGDKGLYGAVGRDGSSADFRGGGVLRLRPDATELEVFSTGTRNHLDVAINEEDDVFTYDNTDEHHWMSRLTHMVEGGFYGYPWDFHPRRPYTLWTMADYGPGAACGALAYTEDALPEEYRGNLFLVDFGKRNMLRVRVARDGATYRVLSREDFFRGVPTDFWPVGIGLSPDGLSLYVTDWQLYDRRDVVVGRLFKLTYTGTSLAAPKPAWYLPASMGLKFEATTAELVRGLAHPAQSVRLVAQRRIAERGATAFKPIEALLADPKAPAHARWHAVWTLDAIDGGEAGRRAILAAAEDGDLSVRRQALRQLAARRVKEAAPVFARLLKDADATIRFQAATALGRLGRASAVPALLAALDERESYARYAVFTALNRIGRADAGAWDAIARGLESPNSAIREGTIFSMRETCDEKVVAALARAARDGATPADTRAAALDALSGLYRKEPAWKGEWWNAYPGVSPYHPALSPRPARTVDWEGTNAVLAALRSGLDDPDPAVRRGAVAGLGEARDRDSAPKLREMFALESYAPAKIAILRTLGILKDAGARGLIADALGDPKGSPGLLLEAITTAEQIGGEGGRGVLLNFLTAPHGGKEVLLRAVETLSKLGGDGAADAVLRLLEDKDIDVRRAAIAALGRLRNRKAVPALLGAFRQEETRFEASLALARMPDVRALEAYLYGVAHVNSDLRMPSARALTSIGKEALPLIEKRLEEGALSSDQIRELQWAFASSKASPLHRIQVKKVDPAAYFEYAIKSPGDAERGRKFFHDPKGLACAKCHKVRGEGGDLGPDLSTIGSQYPKQEIVESVVYPSRKVRDGYQQVIVRRKDGQILSGLVKGETPEELTLVDAENNRHTIRKAEIEARKVSDLSLMPDGLQAGLSLQDLADLIAYLESLKDAPKK